ncbi:MAG: FAD-dependent oxidoreductase [Burkholderiales bacterium]|nr:FAD-dependent oxidoreductase [Burkholderiales bacterium]
MNNVYTTCHSSEYDIRLAMEEASRCLLCYDAPCSKACPAETKPDQFIRAIRFRNFKGAAEIIREANVCGGSCAVVCPAGKLCEGACLRKEIDKPIEIRKLQQFAVRQEMNHGMQILTNLSATKKAKVACIGSGPASLACAAKLAQSGYTVEIFEANAKAGGMLSYGIPPARLSQEIVDWDIKTVTNLGVKIHLNTRVGTDVSFTELESKFAAVFVGCGLWQGRDIGLAGVELEGVIDAVDFLVAARASLGAGVQVAKNVVIIGAGDTGMDCAATAKLLGAENVTVVCNQEEIPAYHEELEYVQRMGITVVTKYQPQRVIGTNIAEGVFSTHQDGYSELKLKAEQVILAVGQIKREDGLPAVVAANGKVFAAGDVVNGGSTVVEAVKQGKLTAATIIEFLAKGE